MADDSKLYAAGAVALGAAFLYSGIKGKGLLSTIQTTVKGSSPSAATSANQVIGTDTNTPAENENIINQATGNTGAQTQTAAQNQAIAQVLALPFGWATGAEWNALVQLWNDESGWSNTAENPSGAYGIAQALPNTKYPLPGRPPSEGGSADATTQIAWGLAYILSRYGDPETALAHENEYHWY